MTGGTVYLNLLNGERMKLPASMPDVEEVPGPLSDEEREIGRAHV